MIMNGQHDQKVSTFNKIEHIPKVMREKIYYFYSE